METQETVLNVLIVKSDGHEKVPVPLSKMESFVEEQVHNKKRWLYVDGVHKMPDEIDYTTLADAQDLRFMNAMIGGEV